METVTARAEQYIALSLTAMSMMWKEAEGGLHYEEQGLHDFLNDSELAGFDDGVLYELYLPMEWLLVRHIQLPLKSPQLVDADMLFQELANSSDIEEGQWWLSSALNSNDEGVAGMLFGLPEAWRKTMQSYPKLAQLKFVWVDGYERLQAVLLDDEPSLVISQDANGVFFGVFDGQVWRGMRRINGDIHAAKYQEILHASIAMGFEPQTWVVQGYIGQDLLDKILAEGLAWQGNMLERLPNRHEANLALEHHHTQLNLRHGSWSLMQGWAFLKPWKRSVVLCGILVLVWIGTTVVDLYRLEQALDNAQQRIEEAFHKGLPNEPVMLDALAQLEQASGTKMVKTNMFLMGLQAISQVYKQYAWHINSLELRNDEMYMAGEVKDIKALNQIQMALQTVLQRDVGIIDTNMSHQQVRFQMHWQ